MIDNDRGIILDVTPGDYERFERQLLEGAGHEVRICHGPDATHGCPLLEDVWSHQPNAAELDGFAALVEAADYGRAP